MNFEELEIKGVYKITPTILDDSRGSFFRYYCKNEFSKITLNDFVQMNHSINKKKGTLRGMHYQNKPFCEEKIIRCIKGSIYDVFVDLRENSSTFLKWGGLNLSSENKTILFLPKGIAHGFITLEDDTELLYQHSEFYHPEVDKGIKYDDPKLNISWPINPVVISEKDLSYPNLTNEFKGIEV